MQFERHIPPWINPLSMDSSCGPAEAISLSKTEIQTDHFPYSFAGVTRFVDCSNRYPLGARTELVNDMTELSRWSNFFVIMGSSAGALIGLQFVVITLVSTLPRTPGQEQAGGAYATPTIVHFGSVLLLSAVLSAPWHGTGGAAISWFLLGLAGIVYAIIVTRRLRAQTAYRPVFEDWLCHALLPCAAYAILAASACAARFHSHEAMFGVAAAALLLLFIGIHNAWDAATYHIFVKKPKYEAEQARSE